MQGESRVGTCREEGCENPIHSRRMCQNHYVRWRATATASTNDVGCDQEDCARIHYARGKCSMHYERLRVRPQKRNQGRLHSYARFGLTRADYEAIMARPCGICGAPSKHLDHDHACCAKGCPRCIRGGLCHRCNVGLGYIEGWFAEHGEAALAWSRKLHIPEDKRVQTR